MNKQSVFLSVILPCLGLLFQPQVVASDNLAETTRGNTSELIGSTPMSTASASNVIKSLNVTVVELKDSTGLIYVGAAVNKADLSVYLDQLSAILTDDFTMYRQNQAARDHNSFHVTLINPYEYQKIDQSKVKFGQQISVSLQGIGIAKEGHKTSYFVVANSEQGQLYRQQFLLKHKDLHVTLGFNPQDVYSVRKDKSSLIQSK